MQFDIITILGPTASGKTTLAAHLAAKLGNAEIISADSRQVYKGMDIGTGKDLADYGEVPYHLIDIAEAGEKYNLFQYQQDFWNTYYNIIGRGKLPILCGGTGLYIESVLKSYKMVPVPENPALRAELEGVSLDRLTEILGVPAGEEPDNRREYRPGTASPEDYGTPAQTSGGGEYGRGGAETASEGSTRGPYLLWLGIQVSDAILHRRVVL